MCLRGKEKKEERLMRRGKMVERMGERIEERRWGSVWVL